MSNIRTRAISAYKCFAFRNLRASQTKLWWASVAAAAALFCMPADPALAAGGSPLMAVSGQPAVGASGAFSYTIPIAVPPGTAGMMPGLALVYSSQAGDDYEGLGWSLAGIPTITHCPRTVTDDGVHGGVNYDPSDRFCLGGQKLVAITGIYGADSTVYHLQSDNFTQIISHSTTGNAPSYFTVQLRNGLTMEFGNTTDSAFKPLKADGTGAASTISIWGMDKATDLRSNYMTVTYANDTTNSQLYPTRIDYTGNAGASLSTYNSVQFAYMDRSADVVPQYQAGTYTTVTKLLTHIRTYNATSVVTDYQLAYNYASSGASHNELATFKQCDSSGTTCLAPTSFTWQGSRDRLTPNTAVSTSSTSAYRLLVPGDFTGKGLTDVIIHDQTCPLNGVVWSASSGSLSRASVVAGYHYYQTNDTTLYTYSGQSCFLFSTPSAADFNGDGISDVMLNASYWVYITADNDWVEHHFTNPLPNSLTGGFGIGASSTSLPGDMIFADFDGDGRADGFAQSTGTGNVYISNGAGTFTPDSGESGYGVGTFIIPGDYDGDGCTDILGQSATNAIHYFCNPATSSASVSNFGSTAHILTGDFNGDGKTDLLVSTSSGATIYYSTGTGLTAGTAISSSSGWYNYILKAGDFNGDGRTDVALLSVTSGTPHTIYLSTGTGLAQAKDPSNTAITIANSYTNTVGTVADWNNDGADDLWIEAGSSGAADAQYTFAYVPELISAVDNGLVPSSTPPLTSVTYDRLNKNGTFYVKGSSATYSLADLDGPYYVVKELDASNGVGGSYAHTYTYAGAIADVTAPPSPGPKSDLMSTGFVAFSSVAATDVHTGAVQTSNIHTDVPYVGQPSSRTLVQGSVTLSSLSYTYSSVSTGGSANAIELTQTVLARHDVTGTADPTVTTSYTYDSYNNPLTVTKSVSDGSSQTITNTYNNDTTHWILSQLATMSDQRIVGTSNVTRHYSYSYGTSGAGTLGEMTGGALEPGTTALELDATFTYDAFGNRLTTYLDGTGVTARTTLTSTYDTAGRFQATATDAISLSTSASYNADFGTVASVTDKDTLNMSVTYDTFGRPTGVTSKDGTKASLAYAYCSGVNSGSASCPSHGATAVTTTPLKTDGTTQNSAATVRFYDALGRQIAQDTQGFDGSWIRQETQYDAYMHPGQTSRPYFLSGGTAKWTVYSYVIAGTSTPDPFGRAWSATAPDSSVTTYAYDALDTTITDANSHATKTTLNAQGLVASVYDANAHTTAFVYDAFGNKTKTTDAEGNVSTATYDTRGRPATMTDADLGYWQYTYDVLSELTTQVDAKSQTTTYTYDMDGRSKRRTEADLTSLWLFDSGGSGGSAYGQGHPYRDCNASTCSSSTYQRSFTYNGLGQTSAIAMKVDGTTYTYSLAYESTTGRVSTVTYPSGFVAKYDYNSYGYLADIKDNSSGNAIWTANARNAELQLTQATSGPSTKTLVAHADFDANTGRVQNIRASNDGADDGSVMNQSYDWDSVGNLAERDDTLNSVTDKYCYDVLDRLVNTSTGGATCSSSPHVFEVYSPSGNDQRKSDVCTGSACIGYGSSAGPHALTGITGTVNGITNPTLTYDANGNMLTSLGRSFTWTSYNMVAQVTQGTTTLGFTYNPDHQRLKQCIGGCMSPTTTTLYLNDPISGEGSEKSTTGTSVVWRDYIVADGRIVASHINNIGVNSMQYFVLDATGSTAALTDTSGNTLERNYYDPWGKRRNANGSADTSCALTSATTRGFSGHEMMDSVCMTNMNGRIYDQYLSRFASADTIVGDPGNGQDYNPYSYVDNRPTVFTDPTGHMSNPCGDPDVECIVVDGNRGDGGSLGDFPIQSDNFGPGNLSGSSNGSGGGSGNDQQKDKHKNRLCNNAHAVQYVNAHVAAAEVGAKKLGVPTSFVLGLSAAESQYGTNRFSTQGNNFFSMQGSSTSYLATGSMQALLSTKTLSTYSSYSDSVEAFVAQYGHGVMDAATPQQFADDLVAENFNTANAATGGDPNFVPKTVEIIGEVAARMKC